MRRFIVGLFAFLGFLVVLLAGGAAGFWYWLKPAETTVADSTVLVLDLTERIPEAPSEDPLSSLLAEERPTLRDVLDGIERAAADKRVKGIFARVGGDALGFATVQELRGAILSFRAAGKPAVAFADSFGEFGPGTRPYYLATAFDEIWLQPMGTIGLTGLRSETPFFRGTLEKLGVEPRFDHRAEYKTAMNVLTEREMTAPHREEVEAILGSLYEQVARDIAKARRLDAAAVERLVGGGPYLDREAEREKLVDRLGYRDEALEALRQRTGGEPIRLTDYLDAAGAPHAEGTRIALIYGTGIVQRGDSSREPLASGNILGAETMVRAFRAAVADPAVRAILFRIDSPGGSVAASETIWRETVRAREAGKKVIVSMGDVAGSGGYYIAAAADKIVAQPGTLTGSIGVVAGKMLTEGFWEKLGVSWDAVQRGDNAAMFSQLEDWSAEAKRRFEGELDAIYAGFKTRVAEGRKLSAAEIEAVAKGRVWTGEQAKERGLVDALGGYAVALSLAREAIGLAPDAPVELKTYPPVESTREFLLAKLLGRERGKGPAAPLRDALALLAPFLYEVERATAGPLTMPPIEPR